MQDVFMQSPDVERIGDILEKMLKNQSNFIEVIEKLTDRIEDLNTQLDELGIEINKHRKFSI